jgi:hypothetical protein
MIVYVLNFHVEWERENEVRRANNSFFLMSSKIEFKKFWFSSVLKVITTLTSRAKKSTTLEVLEQPQKFPTIHPTLNIKAMNNIREAVFLSRGRASYCYCRLKIPSLDRRAAEVLRM